MVENAFPRLKNDFQSIKTECPEGSKKGPIRSLRTRSRPRLECRWNRRAPRVPKGPAPRGRWPGGAGQGAHPKVVHYVHPKVVPLLGYPFGGTTFGVPFVGYPFGVPLLGGYPKVSNLMILRGTPGKWTPIVRFLNFRDFLLQNHENGGVHAVRPYP